MVICDTCGTVLPKEFEHHTLGQCAPLLEGTLYIRENRNRIRSTDPGFYLIHEYGRAGLCFKYVVAGFTAAFDALSYALAEFDLPVVDTEGCVLER